MSETPLAPCSFMNQTMKDTRILAQTWIHKLVSQEQRYTVVLCGPVGAGKTTFVKYCLLALGILNHESDFLSPSFNIVLEYPLTAKKDVDTSVYHIDLYKIKSIKEVEDIGLFESTDGSIRFVEWPERIGWAIPMPYYCISIHIASEDTRNYLFSFVQEVSTHHGS